MKLENRIVLGRIRLEEFTISTHGNASSPPNPAKTQKGWSIQTCLPSPGSPRESAASSVSWRPGYFGLWMCLKISGTPRSSRRSSFSPFSTSSFAVYRPPDLILANRFQAPALKSDASSMETGESHMVSSNEDCSQVLLHGSETESFGDPSTWQFLSYFFPEMTHLHDRLKLWICIS